MTDEGFKRKLAAILSADVEGYSRLMREDEEATVRTITTYRTAMTRLIQQYRGRVVDSPGDNILAEFTSAVDAVNCAVEMQRELAERNAELPEIRRMEFRIGVNVGDVVEEGERIYGDGVNIAARMEGLAEGGGICISGTAYDQVKHKLGLEYEFLGEQEVKNITEPVPAYRVLSFPGAAAHRVIKAKRAVGKTWRNVVLAIAVVLLVGAAVAVWHYYFRPPPMEPASVEKMAYPLPDKPSIAVLPFANLTGDPEQEYFSDGITEQIISTLSKVRNLFVIARNSTFTYKDKPVKVQKIAEDLGVKYVLEGSVKRSADKIRITAQLIDATRGHHVWSEHYDRELKDIFTIQDDITMELTKAMQIELSEGEQARIWAKQDTSNLKAFENFLQGLKFSYMMTKEDNARARQLFGQTIALDSGYAPGYVGIAWTHFFDARFGWSESRAESVKMAFKYGQQTIALDDTLDTAYSLLAALYLLQRQYEKAIAEAERAIALNPNGALAYSALAGIVSCTGRWEEGIELAKKAIRLEPFPPPTYFHWLARAYFMTGQYDQAIAIFKKALNINADYLPAHAFLAACYSSLGREADAAKAAEQVLRINPKFSLESYAKTLPYKNKADVERYISTLRKAGLPNTPPLPIPEKPSIAVLAFENMSGDPGQEYFSDGLSEEIITALSKTPKLFVIARNSSFTYKGKPANVQQIGRELGVKYVLEGSVRRSGDRVRITAQLVDAKTGNHLWAERYDRDLKDIFAVQDEITKEIITALQVKLTDGEQALITAWGTDNFEAYAKFLQGIEYVRRFNREGNLLARKMAEEVIALDPGYPQGYGLLGRTHLMDVWLRLTKSPRKSLAEAVRLFQKAIAMHPSDAVTCGLLGQVYTMMRQHEKGIAESEKAIALNPNVADNHAWFGFVLHLNGRHKEALVEIKKAIRLNPFPPNIYFLYLGNAFMYEGMYNESIAAYKKALRVQPNNLFTHLRLAAAYSLLGREEEAHAEAAEVLRINPKFSLEHFSKTVPFKNQSDTDHLINALRSAGLPD